MASTRFQKATIVEHFTDASVAALAADLRRLCNAPPAHTREDREAWLAALFSLLASYGPTAPGEMPQQRSRVAADDVTDAAEADAWRAAWPRFVELYADELCARVGLAPLSESRHMHRTMLAHGGISVVLTVAFDFGAAVDLPEWLTPPRKT